MAAVCQYLIVTAGLLCKVAQAEVWSGLVWSGLVCPPLAQDDELASLLVPWKTRYNEAKFSLKKRFRLYFPRINTHNPTSG